MLPAAARQLFVVHRLPVHTVRSIDVAIHADPYMRACKCYIRLMASMGFTHVDKQSPEDEDEVVPQTEKEVMAFCGKPVRSKIVASIRDPRIHARLPEVSLADQMTLSRTATVVDSFDRMVEDRIPIGTQQY